MGCVTRFVTVAPGEVLNLTSPRYLPEVSLKWQGQRVWHDPLYEPLRDAMEAAYIAGFDRENGHFERLLESVAREGVRNPVMLSAGRLEKRQDCEIPPDWRGRHLLVSEYLGGSRLWAAARLGLKLPAIVNDYAGMFPDGEVLPTVYEAAKRFRDHPARMGVNGLGGFVFNDLPFVHLDPERRQTMLGQCAIRRKVVAEVRALVADWLAAHDRAAKMAAASA